MRIKEKAMDMYANEVITMEELKAKTVSLNQEIGALKQTLEGSSEKAEESQYNERVFEVAVKKTFKTIEDIICEETLTNEMLKSVIDKIEVSKEGEVKIHIKNLDGDGTLYKAGKGQSDYIAV